MLVTVEGLQAAVVVVVQQGVGKLRHSSSSSSSSSHDKGNSSSRSKLPMAVLGGDTGSAVPAAPVEATPTQAAAAAASNYSKPMVWLGTAQLVIYWERSS
jgi:hypothetical protein